MDKQELAARLGEFAERYAASRGFQFGHGSADMVRGLANQAANNLMVAATVRPQSLGDVIVAGEPEMLPLLAIAEPQLQQFIEGMIEHWQQNPELQRRGAIIGEDTFQAAFVKLCPLFPIC